MQHPPNLPHPQYNPNQPPPPGIQQPAPEPEDSGIDVFPISALVIANVIPLFCVMFFGWQAGEIMVLYWLENVVIGVYNVLRIFFAAQGGLHLQVMKMFMIPFFCVHYGMFCFVHGIFVVVLTIKLQSGGTMFDNPDVDPFEGLQMIFSQFGFWAIPLLALVASHGISFVWNYLLKGEYGQTTPIELMIRPYGRIVILHLAIIFGAMPIMLLGSPMLLLFLLIGGKTILDVLFHRRSHQRGQLTFLQRFIHSALERAKREANR